MIVNPEKCDHRSQMTGGNLSINKTPFISRTIKYSVGWQS